MRRCSSSAPRALARKVLEAGGRSDAGADHRRVPPRAGPGAGGGGAGELLELLEAQTKRIAEGRVDPIALATGGVRRPRLPRGVSPAQLAAYTVVSRVLLNLDETITKE